MASAYKTWWKQENPDADDDFVGFRAEIDPETGDLRMWKQDLEEIDVAPSEEGGEPTLEMKVVWARKRSRSPTSSRGASARRPRSRSSSRSCATPSAR